MPNKLYFWHTHRSSNCNFHRRIVRWLFHCRLHNCASRCLHRHHCLGNFPTCFGLGVLGQKVWHGAWQQGGNCWWSNFDTYWRGNLCERRVLFLTKQFGVLAFAGTFFCKVPSRMWKIAFFCSNCFSKTAGFCQSLLWGRGAVFCLCRGWRFARVCAQKIIYIQIFAHWLLQTVVQNRKICYNINKVWLAMQAQETV